MKLFILLSTYNGILYLEDFLTSLEKQTYQNWNLIVRDDGSSDDTLAILHKFSNNINKVSNLKDRQNLGAKKSFSLLLDVALQSLKQNEYIMFADQDDVWHTDKIQKIYQKMQELEKIHGKDVPLLIHSDLTVVDQNLEIVAHSLWKYQNINPNKQKFSDFVINNNITGCTMMINQALAEKVKTIPDKAIMHDWWIAMVASAFGKIAYINEPLILYRQHGQNDTGAKKYGPYYFIKTFLTVPTFEKYIEQSKAFLALYGHELDTYRRLMLEEFSNFNRLSKFQKIRLLFKYKIWKNGFMRNLGLVVFA